MQSAAARLPQKTREIHNNHMDSTIWNDFKFRPDDIVIATYAKSGTTWMQQIVSQLIFSGEEGHNVPELSPWLDLRLPPAEVKLAGLEAQMNRRFIKTHLPLDAFVFRPEVKHIYIGRDGRDVIWSMHNHHLNMTPEMMTALNEAGPLVGPPLVACTDDPHEYFLDWFHGGSAPPWSLWENVRTWWDYRDLPNIKFVHFNDLKADPEREIRDMAAFLEIDVAPALWPSILEHCSFDYMKSHAEKVVPLGGAPWKGGARTFINKGTNGRWRDRLTAAESVAYEAKALSELGPDCARWLQFGKSA